MLSLANKYYYKYQNLVWIIIFGLFGCLNALYSIYNVDHGRLPNLGNYFLFYKSFYHLINNLNIYHFFAEDHADIFLYSPTFALFMGLFAIVPLKIGVILWDVFNCILLGFAICMVPNVNKKALFVIYVILSAYSSLQSCQTNTIVAGLAILFVYNLLASRLNLAALTMALSAVIKIYGCFPLVLLIFFPKKLLPVGIRFLIFLFILLLLPLIAISWHQLIFLYQSWFFQLKSYAHIFGLSMIHFIYFVFKLKSINSTMVEFVSLVLIVCFIGYLAYTRIDLRSPDTRMCDKLTRNLNMKEYTIKSMSDKFLYNVLAILMIFMVIFNHRAEQQTYIVVYTGIAIWFFTNPRNSVINKLIITILFVGSLLTATRISSLSFKHLMFDSSIQAFMAFIAMLKICIDTIKLKFEMAKLNQNE